MDTEALIKEIKNNIEITMKIESSNDQRNHANLFLNQLLTEKIHENVDIYLNVSIMMIENFSDETLLLFAYRLLEEIIKYNWYNFDLKKQNDLKMFCLSKLLNIDSLSSLLINSCSRLITEIFIREWPNKWREFFPKLYEKHHSLISINVLLNISDYLTKLLQPTNSNRRKEITKNLIDEKNKISNFFIKNLSIMENDDSINSIPIDKRKLLIMKSLESLESLLEWYPLTNELTLKIILLTNLNDLNIQQMDTFQNQLKIKSLQCIQIILKRSIKRQEDTIIINDMFFDLDEQKFANFLIVQTNSYFNAIKSMIHNENFEILYDLFMILLDISIEIVCRVINLLNQDSTHQTIRKNCNENIKFWSIFFQFIFDCLSYNNINFDEIILRFLLVYSKSQISFSDNNDEENNANVPTKSILPFPLQKDTMIPMRLLIIITNSKFKLKSEQELNDSISSTYDLVDSYENYLQIFYENRNKFLTIIRNLNDHQLLSQIFCLSMFNDLFDDHLFTNTDIELFDENYRKQIIKTGIKSWNIAAILCPIYISRRNFSHQHTKILEFYFAQMLEISGQLAVQDLNSLLSCLSSFSPFYHLFSVDLIKKLIDIIFLLTVKTAELKYDPNITDLQNHLNSLFIKLTKKCFKLFLPYFNMMRIHIEELIHTKKTSLVQSYFLFEGLFILSNHLSVEEQRNFLIDGFLPQINWIIDYDFGSNGQTFFQDIGLASAPKLDINELPASYAKILVKISAVLNVLTRLFKRINAERCYEILWPIMMQLISPFCKVIASVHHLWSKYEQKQQQLLGQLCHPFYQPYLFGEYPCHYLLMICYEQSKMFAFDKFRTLFKQWNRNEPPSSDLVGNFMNNRLWILYSQSVALVNVALELMLFFYPNHPEVESNVENFITTNNSLICMDMKFMPIYVYRDLIRCYFQCLTNYSPRTEKFLTNTGCVEILMQFIEFMYYKLNEQFMIIQQEKNICTSNSDPRFVNHLNIRPLTKKDDPKNFLEIIIEATINCIATDFISLLNGIFTKQKNIDHIIVKNESISNDDIDEEMNEGILLSKIILVQNPKTLVTIVMGCLLWPNSNLKLSICNINKILIQHLISREMINTIDAFFDLSSRILQSIMLTKRSDTNVIMSLTNLLFILYQNIVIKNNLMDIADKKLNDYCQTDLNEWKRFSNGLYQLYNNVNHDYNKNINFNVNQIKKLQKMLRNIVETLSLDDISSIHSMKKSNIICLGQSINDKNNRQDADILNTGFLSWL
uniref:Exportin-1/Importin-beta-like domain-containing protein n=1 Tax=Psoroptes ovis TaxID=83912 RepID=A0A3B0QPB3_PSOOV|nr:hypothetical protein QR98_0085950 [Psoroptes ovis]